MKLDYDSEAYFDGILCCSIIGTAVNIGMFLLQAYSMWGNKRVGLKTQDVEIDEITIKNVLEYLESKNDKKE